MLSEKPNKSIDWTMPMKEKKQRIASDFHQLHTNWQSSYEIEEVISKEQFLTGEEVHVWRTNLDNFPSSDGSLSQQEKASAAKFYNRQDQDRYKSSHSNLRSILAAYCKTDPATLRFQTNKYGKPFLVFPYHPAVTFNMTYSKNTACYIFSVKNKVGIDIEYLNEGFDWHSIASLYFTSRENRYIESLAKEERDKAFFYLWTRKEALLKADGGGLTSIEALKKERLPHHFGKYSLLSFKAGLSYQGAIAVDMQTCSVRFFEPD